MKSLGEKLWTQIESVQGFAFISDDMCERSDSFVAPRLRAALKYQREGARIMARLLREYKESGGRG